MMLQVLVVDDDRGTREACGAALRHGGYDVRLADSGSAAISTMLSGKTPHAVLLDLRLGDMTGYDVLRWMREQRVLVPTAVMTAFRAAFDPDEAIALGALAYVDQPISIDDVVALAQSLTAPLSPADDPLWLHTRVLAGHPGALDCLVNVLLTAVPPRLRRRFPQAPWDFMVDATTDACLDYAANPTRFEAYRSGSIVDFVYLFAWRNLSDRLRSEQKRKNRERRYTDRQSVIAAPFQPVGRTEIDLWATISPIIVDAKELRAFEVWLDNGGTNGIACALGLGDLSLVEQRREVKRFKDRLLKRISRYFRPK